MASTAEKVDIKPKKMVPKHYFVLCWKINKVKNQQLVAQILFRQNLPFDPKGILSVRWCFISDPSKSPSALECETHPPSPWGSGRDVFAHSSPAYAGERLRHSRWFPGAYAMLPSGTPSRPNTAMDGFGQQVSKDLPSYFLIDNPKYNSIIDLIEALP
jgi:hypothetical protein